MKLIGEKLKNLRIYILIAVAAVALFYQLNSWGVTETSEARYAQISLAMHESGDFMHPRMQNIQHYHKPPVTYWITAAGIHMFGNTSFAIRFFMQLSLIMQLWLVYAIGKAMFNRDIAFNAACLYLASPLVVMSTRALTTDTYLTTFILATIFSWICYSRDHRQLWLFLFYLFLGFAFLTKGPVAFIFIIPFLVSYHYLIHKTPVFIKHHALGAIIFIITAFSWFLMLYLENSDFPEYFIVNQTINRFATSSFGRTQPVWFYLPVIFATFFPWSILLVKFLAADIKGNKIFFIIAVAIPLLILSVNKSKLILYILPLYGGLALGAAWAWHQTTKKRRWSKGLLFYQGLTVIGLAILPEINKNIHYTTKMWSIWLLLLLTLLIFTVVLRCLPKIRQPVIFAATAFTLILTLFSTAFLSGNPYLANDNREVSNFIESQLSKVKEIYVYNERLPSMAFHLNKNLISLYDGNTSLQRETQFESDLRWMGYLVNLRDSSVVLSKTSVLLIKSDAGRPVALGDLENTYEKCEVIGSWDIYFNHN